LKGTAFQWGKSDISRIYRLCKEHDKLESRWSKKKEEGMNHRKRYKLRKAGRRIRKKIKNLVKEVHCKLTKVLCKNYNYVLLPEFETQRMVKKGMRKIGSKTARQMLTWSHL
jgi:putative transposase